MVGSIKVTSASAICTSSSEAALKTWRCSPLSWTLVALDVKVPIIGWTDCNHSSLIRWFLSAFLFLFFHAATNSNSCLYICRCLFLFQCSILNEKIQQRHNSFSWISPFIDQNVHLISDIFLTPGNLSPTSIICWTNECKCHLLL